MSRDLWEAKEYIPTVTSLDEAFSLLSFSQYEDLGLPIDLTDIVGSLDLHQEWFESLETLDKALTLDSVGALPIETQWVLEAEMKIKGRVKTMSGKPHKPRKLIRDKNITPEEAGKKLKFEASGTTYLWVDWRDGKVQVAANRPTPTSMHVCWVHTPDSPTPFQSTMEGLSNWLLLTGKTIPANLIRSPTELDIFITSSTATAAQAAAQELEDCDWPYLLVDDGLPGMIKFSYDDNLTDYAEDPNNWVTIDSKTREPIAPPPKPCPGPGPCPPPVPVSPMPSPGPLSNLFDAEYREEEVLWKQDFHSMLYTGSDKIFFAFREEEPGVIYTVERLTIDNQPMYRILHIWEPYGENETPYDSYIQKLIIDHDLLNAEPDDLEPEPWHDPTEPWMEEFNAVNSGSRPYPYHTDQTCDVINTKGKPCQHPITFLPNGMTPLMCRLHYNKYGSRENAKAIKKEEKPDMKKHRDYTREKNKERAEREKALSQQSHPQLPPFIDLDEPQTMLPETQERVQETTDILEWANKQDFAAPEGMCLFCDETEGLEVINLDGWPEELCETCRDPEQYLAENWGGDPDGPLAKALEAARAKKPKELQLVRLPCFYCGAEALTEKGVLYYRAQLPSGKWDSVEVCLPCLQKQHNLSAEFDDPRVAGFNNSPYSDQEIEDMPQKFGISCPKCGCTTFKKAMAKYNKNTGTIIYYPCTNTSCDEFTVVQAAESFDTKTWEDDDKVQECVNLWHNKEHANEDNEEEQMDYWSDLFMEKYDLLSEDDKQKVDDDLEQSGMAAESFAAYQLYHGRIIGNYTVSWWDFDENEGSAEFEDFNDALKYAEDMMKNPLTYVLVPHHNPDVRYWKAQEQLHLDSKEDRRQRHHPQEVNIFSNKNLEQYKREDVGGPPMVTKISAESFSATTSPAGTKGSGMSRLKADAIINKVKAHMGPHLDFIEVCGSYRRGKVNPKDLDFVVIPKEGVTLPNILPPNQGVNWVGDKKAQVIIDNETIDFRVSSLTGLGAALMYFTGPAGYNIGMRVRAKKMGLKLNEYGIFDRNTGAYIAGATEADVYQALGKSYKSPDLRGK